MYPNFGLRGFGSSVSKNFGTLSSIRVHKKSCERNSMWVRKTCSEVGINEVLTQLFQIAKTGIMKPHEIAEYRRRFLEFKMAAENQILKTRKLAIFKRSLHPQFWIKSNEIKRKWTLNLSTTHMYKKHYLDYPFSMGK